MKSCSECGYLNPDDLHICLRCAATLQRLCPVCNAEVPGNNKFCGQCGTRLNDSTPDSGKGPGASPLSQDQLLKNLRNMMPASLAQKINQSHSQQLHGQRREVTILCLDIPNLDQASRQIDSEELYLAIDHIMQILTKIVYKYEGTIDQFSGQGLTALFGIPLNHENDPERAVRAAIEMLREIEQNSQELITRFRCELFIRAGINTGSVIIGAMDSQKHVEYTVIGDTVNWANELLTLAKPKEILVSFKTYQRTSPIFGYQTRPISTETDEASLQAYQPVEIRHKPGQLRGLPGLRIPMVGRMDDFNLMHADKELALAQSQSHIILISGDAGLGKSRLVAEFINAQNRNDVRSYWGTCAAYMRITPYRVVADVIRNIIGISELDSIHHQRDALQAYLAQLKLDQQDILPNLLHVLGLLHSDPVVEARLKLLEPLMLQRETQLALRTFFTTVAQLQFSMFIFDDLHWVDQASQEFLEYYCQVVNGHPLILILVSRDFENNEPSRLIAEAAQKHPAIPTRIHLEPLSVNDSRLLVDQFISEKTDSAVILKNSIIRRAAGNPFYTEELVRILMDYGGLKFKEGSWMVTPEAIDLLNEVPGTLQDIILARFDRLPPHLRQTAQKASVLGDSFAFRLLKVIFAGPTEDLRANLSELEERNFLIHSSFGNEEGYLFKHPLLQETIYKTLLRKDLHNLHFEIAQAIESGEHWLPAERNQVLAWHFGESHTPIRAIPFLLASAEKASQHFANETVIQLYRQTLTLMDTNPAMYIEQIRQSKINLGQALKFTGQFDEAAKIFLALIDETSALSSETKGTQQPSPILIESLRELADLRAREGKLEEAVDLLTKGMSELGGEARDRAPTAWRRLVDRLAWVYFRQGKLEEAHNLADLALMDLRSWETDDPITQASLYNTLGGIYWSRSRFQEAISSVERSLSIYQDLGYQWGVSVALTNLGVLNYSIGKWQDCVEFLERADQIRSDFGNHPERPINLINLSEALMAMGDFDRARQKLNTSIELSKRLGSHIYWAYSELKLAYMAILMEDSSEAHSHIEVAGKFMEPLQEISERSAQYFLHLAQLSLLDKDYQTALVKANQALEIVNQGGFQEKKIEILQTLGTLYTEMQNFELAEKYLQQSASMKGGQFNEAISLLELAYLYIRRAQTNPQEEWAWYSQAENLLDRVIGTFTSLGAKRYLRRAQMLHAMLPKKQENEKAPEEAESQTGDEQNLSVLNKQLGIPDGEWYQATILSLELVPNQKVDEEVLFETVAFMIPLLQEIILENGGQILRKQNGLTAIFGAPVTHEDDPVRAVESAMQIANFHADLYQQTQLPVSIRMGITMGKIVAGWSDRETHKELLANGQPLQLALSLTNIVSPSHVWVTQAVHNATAFRFQYNPLPQNIVNQLEEKTFFQLEGEREQILPVRGLIGLRTVFVGRNNEITALVEASQDMAKHTGKMIWIEGDPGIGKSRLTRELENQISPLGVLVLRGTCTARRSDIAFSVFSDLLSSALEIQPNFSPEQIYKQIDHQMTRWSLEPEFRPFLELLAGVQPTGTAGMQLMSLEPEQLRRQTFVSLNRFLTRLISIQPIVLILDDIQWIDAVSADLLLYLSPLIFSHGIMFICVQRLNEASVYEPVLSRIRTMTAQQLLQLKIMPLSIDECFKLLDLFLGEAVLEETLKSLIVQQSGGNPYYIEEFVRMLVEQDYLRVERGKLEVNQTFEINDLRIPSSLETLIRARVDALPVTSRQLLQVASVIGHQFTAQLLSTVAERNHAGPQLDLLLNRGMLHYSNETGLWEFGHPMIEIIVYNTVLKAQRRILHNRTALALESQWHGQESEHADELAYHFGKAENHSKTLDYLILAGERASSRFANDAAKAYFEQAYDLLSAVSDATAMQRWQIVTGLGQVYQFTGKLDASLETLHGSLELLLNSPLTPDQHAGLNRILADTYYRKGDLEQAIYYQKKALSFVSQSKIPAEVAEAARIYARLGWSYFRKANFDEAQNAVIRAEELAAETNNLSALAAAENLLGGINWSLGFTDKAMQHTRLAMLHFQEIGYSWGEAMVLNNLAILEANSGNWNEAANFFQRTLNLRSEMGDVEGIALSHNNLAALAFDQGKMAEAEAAYRASLAVSEPIRISYHMVTSYAGLVRTLLAQKRHREASRILQIAFRLAIEIDAREILTELKRLEAVIHLVNGELDLAEKSVRSSLQSAIEINHSEQESSARRILSDILLRQGKSDQGLQILDEAWERLATNVDELETGRVHAQYTKLWQALGDSEKTILHKQSAYEIFNRLGASYDLEQLALI